MNKEIKQMAKQIFEERKTAQERIEKGEARAKIIESYVEDILSVFDVSNKEKESTALIWGLRFLEDYNRSSVWATIGVLLQPMSETENNTFKKISILEYPMNGNVERVKDTIDHLKIPIEGLMEIAEYFQENLSEYFTVIAEEKTNVHCRYLDIKLKK